MAEGSAIATQFQNASPHLNEWRRFTRVLLQRKLVIFGLVVLSILVISAIFAPWLAPYDPYNGDPADSLQKPSANYLFGTDIQGRDTLSRPHLWCQDSLDCGVCHHHIRRHSGDHIGVGCRLFRRNYRCRYIENHGRADGISDAIARPDHFRRSWQRSPKTSSSRFALPHSQDTPGSCMA